MHKLTFGQQVTVLFYSNIVSCLDYDMQHICIESALGMENKQGPELQGQGGGRIVHLENCTTLPSKTMCPFPSKLIFLTPIFS